MAERSEARGAFVWPPAQGRAGAPPAGRSVPSGGPGGGPRAEVRLAPPRPKGGALARWWRQIEATWLGVTRGTIEARAAALGWEADALSAFCPRCGRTSAPFEAGDGGCPACRSKRLPFDRLVRLGAYDEPLSGWVREVKFSRSHHAGVRVGELLGRQIGLAAAALGDGAPARFVLVPVPTPWRRRVARGIDHPAVLARAASHALNREGVPARVWRPLARAYRPMQTRSGGPARAGNVRGSMWVRRGGPLRRWLRRNDALSELRALPADELGSTVFVVIDDVTTTGATLREACRTLRRALKAGGIPIARLWAGVVAVTGERGG